MPVGTVTFKVTNLGVAFHNFKLCKVPLQSATEVSDSCAGVATPILKLRTAQGGYNPATDVQLGTPLQVQLGIRFLF